MSPPTTHYKGLPAAPGLATGHCIILHETAITLPQPYHTDDPQAAWQKIHNAIEETKTVLLEVSERVSRDIGPEEAAIFEAHRMMLEDAELHDMVRQALREGTNPEAAWHNSIEIFASLLDGLGDATLSARAADVRDVGKQVLARLIGVQIEDSRLQRPSIVLARDLAPSQTAALDHRLVLAFCTAQGGPTSHTAILAKALGIPAIVALGDGVMSVKPNSLILVDAGSGTLTIDPSEAEVASFEQRRAEAEARRSEDVRAAFTPAVTRDGLLVEVFANIGSAADAQTAVANGAEGVGLFRTEFLYLNRSGLPTIDQQVEIYREVIQALGGRPLVVRTLDIGGDKSVDYLGITQEPNPFLGWRGIRMIDEKPELLRDQFYALLKAGQGSDLRIMLPMVARLEEILRARELMDEALVAIRQEMTDYTVKLQFGIMVEVPAAALMVEHFAPHVDFYSIGTNDLTQYTLAVDRMNARVAGLASPFDPAVLKLIERTIRVAHENQRWVGMCGEFAGEPLAVPFLIGVGLDEFSMAPASVPGIKSLLRKLSRSNCLAIAQDVLKLPTADSVRTYLEDVLKRI